MALFGMLVLLWGLVVRVWIVDHRLISSDESVVGLMAREILHGHFSAFYWGQSYGGVEPYVTAVLFWLFGQSATTLNLTPVVLTAFAAILVVLIARLVLPRGMALFAGLLVWVGPAILLMNGTQEVGFRFACLDFGLLAIYLACLIRRDEPGLIYWFGWGLAFGLCLWASLEAIYFLIPCAVLLLPVLRHSGVSRKSVTLLCVSLAGFLIGSLPFLWTTVTSRFDTILHPNTATYSGTIGSRAGVFIAHALPEAMGFRLPYTGAWFGGSTVGHLLFAAAVIWMVGGVGLLLITLRVKSSVSEVLRQSGSLTEIVALIVFVGVYPLIFSMLPPDVYWMDGRYVIFLSFVLAIVVFVPLWLISTQWIRSVIAGAVVVTVAMSAILQPSAIGGLSVQSLTSAFSVSQPSLIPLAVGLKHEGITTGYAGYWVAYNLDFQGRGTLAFTTIPPDYVRSVSLLNQAEHSRTVGWIFCEPPNIAQCVNATGTSTIDPAGVSLAPFTQWLTTNGIPFRSVQIAGFTVVVPATPIPPKVVQAGLTS